MSERNRIATKADWDISPMPSKTETFIIERHFTQEEFDRLKEGHIPGEMEDKWFSYFEDNKLYIHRSWSGNCIYVVEFNVQSKCLFRFKTEKHRVTVNRDETQYACTDISEDIRMCNELLTWFS